MVDVVEYIRICNPTTWISDMNAMVSVVYGKKGIIRSNEVQFDAVEQQIKFSVSKR
jgi:hypothetical protein